MGRVSNALLLSLCNPRTRWKAKARYLSRPIRFYRASYFRYCHLAPFCFPYVTHVHVGKQKHVIYPAPSVFTLLLILNTAI